MNFLYQQKYFNQLCELAANDYKMTPSEIKKDYFMMQVLRSVNKGQDNFILKGGTSLSKAYNITHRFSEDLDLAVSLDEKNSLSKSKLNNIKFRNVANGLKMLGLPFEAEDPSHGISERRNMNVIKVNLPVAVEQKSLRPYVKVEEETFSPAFPVEQRQVQSYIGQYYVSHSNDPKAVLSEFPELSAFKMLVQTPERTMIDKIMTIADDYLALKEHHQHLEGMRSRDLYDIVKINTYLQESNYDFNHITSLLPKVREIRYKGDQKKAFSADPKYNIKELISQSFKEFEKEYQADYSLNTNFLISNPADKLPLPVLMKSVTDIVSNEEWKGLLPPKSIKPLTPSPLLNRAKNEYKR